MTRASHELRVSRRGDVAGTQPPVPCDPKETRPRGLTLARSSLGPSMTRRALYNAWRRKMALRKRAEKSHRGQRSAYLELRNAMTARLKAELA